MKVLWRKGTLPKEWQLAEGCFVPKGENSEGLSEFRTISLLSVECKMYFSLQSKRVVKYLIGNQYIDTSVQKGGIAGMSGCLEHTAVISQLIKEAKEGKSSLAVIWLDLANAYGSVPHSLVEDTLKAYHVPGKVRDIIQEYYRGLHLRFNVDNYTTGWQRLEKGIPTGCTISVILFAAAMNLIMKAAEKECRGPKMKSGIRQPPGRAFMDDMTITTEAEAGARWILKGLEKLIKWARMSFKPRKSRSLVIKKVRLATQASLR